MVRRHGMRMVGPNCMGVVNADPAVSMNATFAPAMPPFGHAALRVAVGRARAERARLRPRVRHRDLAVRLHRQQARRERQRPAARTGSTTRRSSVILMYVENFGNPARFLEIAGRITKTKPIIVVKSGRSQGRRARGVVAHRRAGGERHARSTRCSRRPACCARRRSKSCSTWRWRSRCGRCRVRAARPCSPTPAVRASSPPTRWRRAARARRAEPDDGRRAQAALSRGSVDPESARHDRIGDARRVPTPR